MNVDPNGRFFFSLLFTIVVGAVFAATSSVLTQIATTGTVDWSKVGISALFGGIAGALSFTGIRGIVGQFFIQGSLAVLETVSLSAVDGTLSQLTPDQLALTFVLAGALGSIGAKNAAKEFKRVSQIEKSLVKVLKRGFTKDGFAGLKKVWADKSVKYVKEFLKPLIRSSSISTAISTAVNISTYWMQKLYEILN